MNLWSAISIGLKEIWAHKFRSLLTMLGIILGASSLIAMSALVKGREVAAKEALIATGGLQKIRMGARLETSIDAPEPLLKARVPPMMLATLVENAIKHGIAPLAEGGAIRITAERLANALKLTVADTGRGLGSATSGSGVGLANIRARLSALYGERAALYFEANAPRGVAAVITLPLP